MFQIWRILYRYSYTRSDWIRHIPSIVVVDVKVLIVDKTYKSIFQTIISLYSLRYHCYLCIWYKNPYAICVTYRKH